MNQTPNILLIMVDQLTAFALSSYGNTVTKTPNIDAFAAKSTVFENAYCNYPLCAPSRFALMSGRLPSRIGAYDNAAELAASTPTMAHYLRDAGYYTCLSGKMHFVGPDQHHGFEERLTTEIYPADFSWTPPHTYDTLPDPELSQGDGPAPGVSSVETITDAGPKARSMQMDYDDEVIHRTCQHLFDRARQDDSRPMFLTVSFTQPHDPYVSRQEFWDLYSDEEIDLPRTPPIPLSEMDPHSRSLYFHYSLNKFDVTQDIYRRARRGYYAMISDLDQKIGRLLQTLKECSLDENTLIVFTSDHGDMLGERGLWFKKNLFEPAIRVPMIVHWPKTLSAGNEPQQCAQMPVSLLDILPTFLEAASISPDALATPIEGESLFSKLAQSSNRYGNENAALAEHLDGGTKAPRVMLREGNLKMVHSLEYPSQLYDLSNDRQEMVNLADHPDWRDTKNDLLRKANSIWDLAKLKQDVIDNQRVRQLLMRSLMKGQQHNWEHYPNPHKTATRWVRQNDYFPEIEQRGYISYPLPSRPHSSE